VAVIVINDIIINENENEILCNGNENIYWRKISMCMALIICNNNGEKNNGINVCING